MLKPECERRRIGWRWELDPAFPELELDAGQMEQVFLNVFRNSIEAIGEDGCIVVRLETAGDRPRIVIEDTGGGIDAEVEAQLFTSFFTTKPTGAGVGLTLVREILTAHGFDFGLESAGQGRTAFRITA